MTIEEKEEFKKGEINKKNNKEIEFKKWKDEYIKNFDYMSMTNEERHILLINTFKEHNVIYRADSHLCNHFIRGFIDDKCIEHITAIIKMTSILFSYHNIIYSTYHEECKTSLENLMFKNRKKKAYTWLDAVDDTHNLYENRFTQYRYSYYIY